MGHSLRGLIGSALAILEMAKACETTMNAQDRAKLHSNEQLIELHNVGLSREVCEVFAELREYEPETTRCYMETEVRKRVGGTGLMGTLDAGEVTSQANGWRDAQACVYRSAFERRIRTKHVSLDRQREAGSDRRAENHSTKSDPVKPSFTAAFRM